MASVLVLCGLLIAPTLAHDDFGMVQMKLSDPEKTWGAKYSPQGELVQPKYSNEIMAFVHWVNELGVKKDEATCEEEALHLGHYSQDASLHTQIFGNTVATTTGGDDVSKQVFCSVFGPNVVDANAGLVSVEHCNGVWRGAFAPFRNGTGGAFPPELLHYAESQPRYFVIFGHLTNEGKLVADEDYTCVGLCNVDYAWTCPGGPVNPWGSEYSDGQLTTPKYSQEVMAFVHWTNELGVKKDEATCEDEALHLGHYSKDATINTQIFGNIVATTTGGDDVSKLVFCTVFGPKVVDANAGLVSVEHCNGVWRGAFAPFRNGTNGAFPPELLPYAESQPRYFVIWGKINDEGKFVADVDHTCVGFCNVDYAWTC